jgi:membrane protease YdiL (CAAX protease family)
MLAPLIGERFPNVGTEHSSEGVAVPTTFGMRQDTGVRGWVRRHPLTAFLIMGVGLALLVMSVAILAQFGLIPGRSLPGRVGLEMERVAAALSILVLFPAALLITALEGGRMAVRELFSRMLRWRVGIVWWAFALLALPTTTVLLAMIFGDSPQLPAPSVLAGELLGLAAGFFLINIWEEATWAGFFQTHLERRHNFFVAAALTGLPFTAVHMPLQIINGEVASGIDLVVAFALLFVVTIVVRSLFGMVLRGAANSVLLVAVTHVMFNRSANSDGIVADILSGGDNRQMAVLLATLVLAVVLGVILRKKLSRSFRRELDERERKHAVMTDAQQATSP